MTAFIGLPPASLCSSRCCTKSPQIKAVSFRNAAHRLFMGIFVVVDNLCVNLDALTTPSQKNHFEKWYFKILTLLSVPLFVSPVFSGGICAG